MTARRYRIRRRTLSVDGVRGDWFCAEYQAPGGGWLSTAYRRTRIEALRDVAKLLRGYRLVDVSRRSSPGQGSA